MIDHGLRRLLITFVILLLTRFPMVIMPTDTSAQTWSAQYTIQSIGVIKGDLVSAAFAISGDGIVVGVSFPEAGNNHAVRFADGKLRAINGDDKRASVAWAINADGQTTGNVFTPDQTSAAVIWHDGETTTLPTLGGENAQAYGINDDSIVVGGSNSAPGGVYQACRWENGEVTALAGPEGTSLASAINESGQIAGTASNHATLWDGDQTIDLGTLGGTNSLGRAINDRSQVAGHSTTTADGQLGAAGTHAFLWESGKMRDLGTLPGGTFSLAWGISADGVVTGSAEHPDRADDPLLRLSAVAWIDGEIVDLNELIPSDSNWVLTAAYAINDTGQIAGTGYFKGKQRGFVLTPTTETE
jgi:probable HAF family extracellular repeat protein